MMTAYTTINYKDKMNEQYSSKIEALLSELPSYCTDYERYARNKNSIKTRMEYLLDINNFFRYLITVNPLFSSMKDITLSNLEKLNGFDFDAYLAWLSNYKYDNDDLKEKRKSNTNASKKRKMMAIKSLFHFLYIRDYISCNPTEKAIIPVVKTKKRNNIVILEDDECKRFIKAIDDAYDKAIDNLSKKSEENQTANDKIKPLLAVRDKTIVYLILGTGLRISELCAINCADISFELGYINVIRKGEGDDITTGSDKVYLSDEVATLLSYYINNIRDYLYPDNENYDALFISSKHIRMTPRGIELMVKKYANIALGTNNNIHPHTLRATFGTRYYEMTKDISATSTAMNHSGIEITAKYYIRENKEAKQKVAEMKI